MRELHRAMVVIVACCLATSGIFLIAYSRNKPRLTSSEILAATRSAVDEAVRMAVEEGGLQDSESFLRELIARNLVSSGFPGVDVSIVRENDFDESSAFFFDVAADSASARFSLEGVIDPLLAMRLGLDWPWREDPHHPYEIHGESSVMSDCLTNHYFHLAEDAPDFFARLENRTEDGYHYGVETFVVVDGQITVDHLLLGSSTLMDESHRLTYGLR